MLPSTEETPGGNRNFRNKWNGAAPIRRWLSGRMALRTLPDWGIRKTNKEIPEGQSPFIALRMAESPGGSRRISVNLPARTITSKWLWTSRMENLLGAFTSALFITDFLTMLWGCFGPRTMAGHLRVR